MNSSKHTSRRHRQKRPLNAEELLRQMQRHPTITAVILAILFAFVAAYLAVDMAI